MRFAIVLVLLPVVAGLTACGLGADTSLDLFAGTESPADGASGGFGGAAKDAQVLSDAESDIAHSDVASCSSVVCSGDTPYCDPVTGGCVECLGHAQCGADAPYCSGQRACVECISDGHCQDSDYPHCFAAEGKCVECVDSTQCSAGTCSSDHECSQ